MLLYCRVTNLYWRRIVIANNLYTYSGDACMKDIFTEYIWFLITLFGSLLGLQMLLTLFFKEPNEIYNIVNTILGGLM